MYKDFEHIGIILESFRNIVDSIASNYFYTRKSYKLMKTKNIMKKMQISYFNLYKYVKQEFIKADASININRQYKYNKK